VAGGNWKIFDNMVNHSGAALYRNATVSSIALDAKKTKNGAPRYRVSTKDTANLTALAEGYPVSFDKIIVASPWQFSNIAADEDVIRHTIEEIPYMKLHVTLFSSPYKLRPGFFGLEDGAKAPSNVYTTLGADEEPRMGAAGVGRTGFYSISTLRRVVNPKTEKREFVYKIFSPEPVTTSFLSDILGVNVPEGFTADSSSSPISWYHPTWFHSYPVELPRVTFQDPIVGDGVYYTSGMEGFISTMETSALMGMNVARLIADDVAGVERTAEGRRVEKEEKKEAATGEEL
jgi:prenylcysteine oxidase/farnesylcysteine lyase